MRRSPRREGTAAVLAAFVLAAPAGAIRISRGGDDSHGTSTMIPQPGAHPRMPWVAQLGEPSDVTSMPDVCRGRGECSAGACTGSFTCARTTPDPTAGETVCVDATGGLAQFCGSGAPDVACQPTRTCSVTRVGRAGEPRDASGRAYGAGDSPKRSDVVALATFCEAAIGTSTVDALTRLQPAKRLMLAVLTDAVELLLQAPVPTVARRALLRRKAAEWMRSNDRRWLFSFLNICETLGFEASRLRSRVLRLAEQRHGVPERGP